MHQLLKTFLFLTILFSCTTFGFSLDEDSPGQEFYEIRIYKIFDFEKQQQVEQYLERALVPALNRMEIDRVGVFRRSDDENDHSMFVLIPYKTMDQFTNLNERLGADEAYQTAAADHFSRELKDPAFARIESRFMKAFAGMPVIEMPKETEENAKRIFELRLYESHTEHHAALKVDMFNQGEIQIMRDTELAPVFFGETLIGQDAPNLIYMLSAPNAEAHAEHWKAFLAHPEWKRMSKMEKYKGTVSKIKKWILTPTGFSQI
jgi:hypothetical protein